MKVGQDKIHNNRYMQIVENNICYAIISLSNVSKNLFSFQKTFNTNVKIVFSLSLNYNLKYNLKKKYIKVHYFRI